MNNIEDDNFLKIQTMKYQYAIPKKYNGKTESAEYKIDTEWHNYFCVDGYKNYFIEDYLEFLRALKIDLEAQLEEVNKNIDKEVKTRSKRK